MTRLFKRFIFVALLLPISFASLAKIKVGSKAPNFTLSDQNSIQHQLSDYEGSWVILYFYPKDDTPGCTTQACDFRDAVKRIIASKSNVFGVSLIVLSLTSVLLIKITSHFHYSLMSPERSLRLTTLLIIL